MRFSVLTLFPTVIEAYFSDSITAKAVEEGKINYRIVNFRDFAYDKHKTCDDSPYGGGAGMVIKPEPLGRALSSIEAESIRTIYVTPSGTLFKQSYAAELSKEEELIIICGKYEGVDQRIINKYVDDEICVGDYVLSSGELAALIVIDSVLRLCENIINRESLEEESFIRGLLEYPHYTRPEEFSGEKVPEVLLSGHHEKIRKWRVRKSIEKTLLYRPDLIDYSILSDEEKKIVEELRNQGEKKNGCVKGY